MYDRLSTKDKIGGGVIAAVEECGVAAQSGIQVGDRIISINGFPVRDVLDVMFYTSGEDQLDFVIERNGERKQLSAQIEDDIGFDLGIEFCHPTFDGIRHCRNHCEFCFVEQLPSGLRKSLYIKDDDYRYSVLSGSFVTLTNLTEQDWTRLEEQRLGPLRISVHSTDIAQRRGLLGNPIAPDIMTQIRRLAALHIGVHCQVVLVPDQNDSQWLVHTISDLASFFPTVESIAIVPVGRTKYSPVLSRDFSASECIELVKQIESLQRSFRREHRIGLVYLGDEFYMRAGKPVPSSRSYDGFPQYENGVGMVRCLIDDWSHLKKSLRFEHGEASHHVTALCGTSIATTLSGIMEELASLGGPKVHVWPIENHFFGSTVTTSGLLTAADVLDGLNRCNIGDMVILPRAMLDSEGKMTIDGESPDYLESKIGVPVGFAGMVSEMLSMIDCALR